MAKAMQMARNVELRPTMMLLTSNPPKPRVNRTLVYGSVVGAGGKSDGTGANRSALVLSDVAMR